MCQCSKYFKRLPTASSRWYLGLNKELLKTGVNIKPSLSHTETYTNTQTCTETHIPLRAPKKAYGVWAIKVFRLLLFSLFTLHFLHNLEFVPCLFWNLSIYPDASECAQHSFSIKCFSWNDIPLGIFLCKVNSGNVKTMSEICLKLTTKTPSLYC